MKIEKIESFLISDSYVVRIRTDNGLSGLGQTACWGYPEAVERVVHVFESYLIGQNPLRLEHHWQYLYRMAPFRGTVLAGAISAVDIALWDIKGKHFGVPVWEPRGPCCGGTGQWLVRCEEWRPCKLPSAIMCRESHLEGSSIDSIRRF